MGSDSSRRRFLKIAGIAALGAGTVKLSIDILASSLEKKKSQGEIKEGEKSLKAKRWGLVIDTRKIKSSEDLNPMIEKCHKIHNVPEMTEKRHEIKWLWEEDYEHVFFSEEHEFINERVDRTPFLVLCNHCKNPACVRVCPTKATFKRESDGIVQIDMHRCIGCRFCMAACPYGARSFNFQNPRPFIKEINIEYPTRMKGVVEKCNFCVERLAIGKMPACVELSNGALTFGDMDDPNSNVRGLLKENFSIQRKLHLGTGPSVYYIV